MLRPFHKMRESLSEYINRIMRQKGLSLRDVSDRSGGSIAASYIGALASGRVTNITTDKLQSLATGLGVDVLQLCAVICRLEYSPERFDALALLDLIQRISDNPDMAEMLGNLIRLTAKERRAVLEMTRNLLKDKKA